MPKDIGGYRRIAGTARNYVDLSTGEILSRTQRDQRIGALAESGFKTYGQRRDSLRVANEYTNKSGQEGTKFNLHGVADPVKAAEFMKRDIGASDTAFYSVRMKLADGSWRSVATSDANSLASNIQAFMLKYGVHMDNTDDNDDYDEDIEDEYGITDIEFVVLD